MTAEQDRPTRPEPERDGAVERVAKWLSVDAEWQIHGVVQGDLRTVLSLLSTAERQRDEARAEHERDMEEMAKAAQNLQSQRIALFTAVTALRETRERIKTWPLDDNETCMCGSPVEGHSIGSGHAPVSQGDHAISLLVESIDEALQSIGSGE